MSALWPDLNPGPGSIRKRKLRTWQQGAKSGCSFCIVVVPVTRDAKDPYERVNFKDNLSSIQAALLEKNGMCVLELKRYYITEVLGGFRPESDPDWAGNILVYPEGELTSL